LGQLVGRSRYTLETTKKNLAAYKGAEKRSQHGSSTYLGGLAGLERLEQLRLLAAGKIKGARDQLELAELKKTVEMTYS